MFDAFFDEGQKSGGALAVLRKGDGRIIGHEMTGVVHALGETAHPWVRVYVPTRSLPLVRTGQGWVVTSITRC